MPLAVGQVGHLLLYVMPVSAVVQVCLLSEYLQSLLGRWASGMCRLRAAYAVVAHADQHAVGPFAPFIADGHCHMSHTRLAGYAVFHGILAVGVQQHGGKLQGLVNVGCHADVVLQVLAIAKLLQLQVGADIINLVSNRSRRAVDVGQCLVGEAEAHGPGGGLPQPER